MELEEFKSAWEELDFKVTHEIDQSRSWRQRQVRSDLQARIRLIYGTPIYELVSGIVAVLVIGSFLGDGPYEARFMIPAILLHLSAILVISSSVWQLVAVSKVNYAEPILVLQRQVEQIRLFRARMNTATFILAFVLWTPLWIVGMHAWLHLDVYQMFGWPYIIGNLIAGLAIALGILGFLSWRGSLVPNSAFADQMAGRGILKAKEFLKELAEFEK